MICKSISCKMAWLLTPVIFIIRFFQAMGKNIDKNGRKTGDWGWAKVFFAFAIIVSLFYVLDEDHKHPGGSRLLKATPGFVISLVYDDLMDSPNFRLALGTIEGLILITILAIKEKKFKLEIVPWNCKIGDGKASGVKHLLLYFATGAFLLYPATVLMNGCITGTLFQGINTFSPSGFLVMMPIMLGLWLGGVIFYRRSLV